MRKIAIKGLVDEDFTNYYKPSMFIIFPKCSFKCDKEFGSKICQNSQLAKEPIINFELEKLISRYKTNSITKSIVCGGLEPFDSLTDLIDLIEAFRRATNDDIIIYTGYTEKEIAPIVNNLISKYSNIIIKYGRYIPNSNKKIDNILKVELASDNQYAKKYNGD